MADESRTMLPFKLRRLTASDAASYRSLRLEGLHSYPEAFGASWEDEAARPLSWFVERLERNFIFGGLRDDVAIFGISKRPFQSPFRCEFE